MRFYKRLMQTLRMIALLGLLALAVLWCLQNRQTVSVSLMPFSYGIELPLFLMVLLLFSAAYALAVTQSFFQQLRLKRRIKELQRRLSAIELSQTQEQLAKRLKEETLRDADDTDELVPHTHRLEPALPLVSETRA